jgi:hypothetical protein
MENQVHFIGKIQIWTIMKANRYCVPLQDRQAASAKTRKELSKLLGVLNTERSE